MSFIWEENVRALNSWDTLQEIQEILLCCENVCLIFSDTKQIGIIMADNYPRLPSNDSKVIFLINSITRY